jgi:hypothetical protein
MAISVQDIHKTIQALGYGDRRARDLEALLICRDDLLSLLESLNSHHSPIAFDAGVDQTNGDIRIFGVKVITSEYVPQGSIFKIFKDDAKQMDYPPEFQPTVLGGGMIFPKYTPPIMQPLHDDPKPLVDDDKKKVEKRHSETRKIELGE